MGSPSLNPLDVLTGIPLSGIMGGGGSPFGGGGAADSGAGAAGFGASTLLGLDQAKTQRNMEENQEEEQRRKQSEQWMLPPIGGGR